MAVMVVSVVANSSSANANSSNKTNANFANSRRRHSISTSTLLGKPTFATMNDYTPLKRLPLAPPASSSSTTTSAMRYPLPMPTPSSSSASSPSARKMAAELRRHSFLATSSSRATAPSSTTTPTPTPTPSTSARSPVKVLSTASANAQIQRGFTSTTASSKPHSQTSSASSRELPILRFHYVARDVRVSVGPSWKLQRFEVKSLRLQTGAQPTLFIFSTNANQRDSFELPVDTTCSVQNGVGLKLKSRSDSHMRVRVRFTTAADASIWSRLIQDALDHANWMREHEEVNCLKQDANSRVIVMRHSLTKKERVVKVLPNVRLDNGDCEEVRILKKLLPLAHRYESLNFLSEYRVVETLHDVQIVMPKHGGKTLLQFLSERSRPQLLSENEARSVMMKMCETLQALHLNDIVHCDLKLENVLLSACAKDVCVIDFGGAYDLARPNDQQPTRKMVGTPGYIAPERILVDEPPTPTADLFSLGIILYQVLVGQHPFGKAQAARRRLTIEDSLSLDWTHMQRRLEDRNVSEEAQRLVARLVEADPRKRISLDQVLTHEWITNQCA